MQIEFTEQEQHLSDLLDMYNALDPELALFMNHYELSNTTGINASEWKEFITHPKVSAYIDAEILLYQKHQIKKMVRDASDDKRAVGAAQMINALSKLDAVETKTGPIIIYTHVPLTTQQEGSAVEQRQEHTDIIEALQNWEDEQPV